MATRTVAAGGGNFNAGGTWVGGVAPVNGDDIIANASSGNLTVTATTPNLLGANFTGYTGTLALGSNNMLFNVTAGNGTLTISPSMTITRTVGSNGTFRIQQSTTIVSNGKDIPFSTNGSPTITLSGDLTASIFNNNSSPVITGNANFIIADPAPVAISSTTIAAGSKVIYRPAGGLVTLPSSPIGTGHHQIDAGTVSVGGSALFITNASAAARNAPTIIEFLQTPIWTGTGTSGGKPIFNHLTNNALYSGLTTSIIMATNSRIAQFAMDGGNSNIIGLSIENTLNIDKISFKSSFANVSAPALYNVVGSGGFSASNCQIMGIEISGAGANQGINVRFAADAQYIINSLSVTGFPGNSPSCILSSLTSSVPVTMNISNGGFSYANITDINNTGTTMYALTANGNQLLRTTGFIGSVSAGGAGGSFTFVN